MKNWFHNILVLLGIRKHKPVIRFGARDNDGFKQVYRDERPIAKMYVFSQKEFEELRDAIKRHQDETFSGTAS